MHQRIGKRCTTDWVLEGFGRWGGEERGDAALQNPPLMQQITEAVDSKITNNRKRGKIRVILKEKGAATII